MTRRIFMTVTRGMTDKTPVCIYPWEKRLLELIHGGDVQEVSIDEMCSLSGAVKIERVKQPRIGKNPDDPESDPALTLRQQMEAMVVVDPDYDPAQDPAGEYGRLIDKYGMDKDMPLPVVTRIYGEFDSGTFAAALEAAAKTDEPRKPSKPVADMSINELRAELTARGIDFDRTATKEEMRDLLEMATA